MSVENIHPCSLIFSPFHLLFLFHLLLIFLFPPFSLFLHLLLPLRSRGEREVRGEGRGDRGDRGGGIEDEDLQLGGEEGLSFNPTGDPVGGGIIAAFIIFIIIIIIFIIFIIDLLIITTILLSTTPTPPQVLDAKMLAEHEEMARKRRIYGR